MNFGEALTVIKNGGAVRRKGWNGKGMKVFLQRGERSKISAFSTDPYLVMFTAQQTYQPGWLASQADLLGEDWEEVTHEV